MFWSAGLPIRPVAEMVDGFVDVPKWPGCGDRTWCVMPPEATADAESDDEVDARAVPATTGSCR
jgi:hypothetical protein